MGVDGGLKWVLGLAGWPKQQGEGFLLPAGLPRAQQRLSTTVTSCPHRRQVEAPG